MTDDDTTGGTDFGWRVHGAVESWTAKVDGKASIALAIEAATLTLAIGFTDSGRLLDGLLVRQPVFGLAGFALLCASVALAILVIFPRLRARKARRNWSNNAIYFGHLRFWNPSDLASFLKAGELSEIQLATQLVTMSKIAWWKHVALQWSLIALVLGCFSLALCYFLMARMA